MYVLLVSRSIMSSRRPRYCDGSTYSLCASRCIPARSRSTLTVRRRSPDRDRKLLPEFLDGVVDILLRRFAPQSTHQDQILPLRLRALWNRTGRRAVEPHRTFLAADRRERLRLGAHSALNAIGVCPHLRLM